jgi:tyrosyl-tRNA synthetase
MTRTAEEEVALLRRRTVDFVSADELRSRIEAARAERRPLRVKYGADPSAPDIHLGHVVGLNKLREFQDLGHTVVFIVGDFTARIGDPSGRSRTRPPLSEEEVQRHAATYRHQVFRVLDPQRTEVRFNSEWFSPMRLDEVIRLAAHATVSQMLAREDFARRHAAGQPISLVEFLYPLIQAYDSVRVNADVEIGGTDQLFNLLLGREIQKAHGQPPQVIMTLPLLEGLDGTQKMSKSLGNYVGITEPPGEMFGKIMSVSDDLMWRYFELVLALDAEEIVMLRQNVAAGKRHPRAVKEDLARRIVERFHGAEAAREASEEFARVFSRRDLPSHMTEIRWPAGEKNGPVRLAELLVHAGLAPSRSEARRLIQQGAVRLDDRRVTDPMAEIHVTAPVVVRAGRRGFARIVPAE